MYILNSMIKPGDEIDIWAGVGGSALRIKGILIDLIDDNCAKVEITDNDWIDHCGWSTPWYYECTHLDNDHGVRYDDYCWSPKGFVSDDDLDIRDDWFPELWPKE